MPSGATSLPLINTKYVASAALNPHLLVHIGIAMTADCIAVYAVVTHYSIQM